MLSLAFVLTTTDLILPHRVDLSLHNSTLATWFHHLHFETPLICHLLNVHRCFIDSLVKRRYLQPPSVAYTWSTKSNLRTSREAKERSTLLNPTIARCSIECIHSYNRCTNRIPRWYILMKQCLHSALLDRRVGRTTERGFELMIQIWELLP